MKGLAFFLERSKDGRAASAMASGQQIELGDLLTNSKGGRFLPLKAQTARRRAGNRSG